MIKSWINSKIKIGKMKLLFLLVVVPVLAVLAQDVIEVDPIPLPIIKRPPPYPISTSVKPRIIPKT